MALLLRRSPATTALFLLLLHLLAAAVTGRRSHEISFRSPSLRPSSLLWDPTAQHFLVGSGDLPVVSSVSDAGVLETIINDPLLPQTPTSPSSPSTTAAVASSPPSPAPAATPLTSSPTTCNSPPPTAASSSLLSLLRPAHRCGRRPLQRRRLQVTVFSSSAAYGEGGHVGLAGIARSRKGYFLALQAPPGRIFRVDGDDGAARLALIGGNGGAGAAAACIAVRRDGDDGWSEAAVYDEVAIGGGKGRRVGGVAAREGSVYVLVAEDGHGGDGLRAEHRIEELEWEREKEGEWVVGLVLMGLGLAYFLYWRFQMGRLVTSMNKKRA
ncbi:unnamed protein product [Spirodela intermedia]|uniref:Uncharacterized protein n=1 Tax=Spirodela intermedia TaxID=51605 RepID=A0A7I8JTN7_SPIIN|nr:unnamed protein product [Spirodela intermedia]CAA6673121.1 unnamed protein product [Spirodela intermedia]